MLRSGLSVLTAALVSWGSGCADDRALEVPGPVQYAAPVRTGDAGPRAECDEAPEGTPCGAPGSGMHCIYDACLRNVCGDAVAGGFEACDDGNEINGDGCSDRCEVDACGTGPVEPGESCDAAGDLDDAGA